MNQSDFKSQMTTIKIALEAIAGGFDSHERRDQRLAALQRLIERFKGLHNWRSYQEGWQFDMDTFQALWEFSTGCLERETHTDVKSRVRLAIDICNRKLNEIDRKERPHIYLRTEVPDYDQPPPQSNNGVPNDMSDIPL